MYLGAVSNVNTYKSCLHLMEDFSVLDIIIAIISHMMHDVWLHIPGHMHCHL